MTYQVLARKWRPRHFAEMVGQTPVLRALGNALATQRLHHAYLLSGTRGVGKTSLARILAKCVNCAAGISASPCGTCHACQDIDHGCFVDLLELDAASRTKVEDTRELLEHVQYAPTQGRYKVYLIDEVHMLSGHSFNALLKTLEEPPAHVLFILATTDPERLPITVRSRCLQFNLQKITEQQLSAHLAHILQQEQIAFENDALPLLAQAADGSLRDALSLLDQAIAFSNGHLRTQAMVEMLGHTQHTLLVALLQALAHADSNQLLHSVDEIAANTVDFTHVLDQLLTLLHHVAVTQQSKHSTSTTVLALSQQLGTEAVQLYYQIGLLGKRDLALAPTPQVGFMMVMLRMLAFERSVDSLREPTDTTTAPPPRDASPNIQTSTEQNMTPPAVVERSADSLREPTDTTTALPPRDTSPNIQTTTEQNMTPPAVDTESWSKVLAQLNLSGISHTIAQHCVLDSLIDNHITLAIDSRQQALLSDKHKQRLTEALSHYYKRPLRLTIRVQSDLATPARQAQLQQTQAEQAALLAIRNDPHIKSVQKEFDAHLQEETLTLYDNHDSLTQGDNHVQ